MRRILISLLLLVAVYAQADTYLTSAKFPPAKIKGVGGFAYGRYIVGCHQQSLFDFPADVDVYRFVEDDAFDPGVLAVITRKGDRAIFHSYQPVGPPSGNVRAIACEYSRPLTKSEWAEFQRLFDQSGFWQKSDYIFRAGNDGYDYTLEARVKGKYHFTIRWEPEDYAEDKAFAKLGDWISHRVKRVGLVRTDDGQSVVGGKGDAIILGK